MVKGFPLQIAFGCTAHKAPPISAEQSILKEPLKKRKNEQRRLKTLYNKTIEYEEM
jgi:hypothetical protein